MMCYVNVPPALDMVPYGVVQPMRLYPVGMNPEPPRDHSLKVEGAILITGMEGFNPVNLLPGTLTPIFTITTHSDSSNCEN